LHNFLLQQQQQQEEEQEQKQEGINFNLRKSILHIYNLQSNFTWIQYDTFLDKISIHPPGGSTLWAEIDRRYPVTPWGRHGGAHDLGRAFAMGSHGDLIENPGFIWVL
jgi:hypothetical protein